MAAGQAVRAADARDPQRGHSPAGEEIGARCRRALRRAVAMSHAGAPDIDWGSGMAWIKNLFAACCAVVVLALSGQARVAAIGPDHQAGRSGAARRQHRRRGPPDGGADRPGAGRDDRRREPPRRQRHDRHRAGVARGARRQHAADDRQHLSDRRPDAEGELPSGDRLRSDLLPGAVAGGVRGQQRVALQDAQGSARRGARQARRTVDGGGRPRHDLPDGLHHVHRARPASP